MCGQFQRPDQVFGVQAAAIEPHVARHTLRVQLRAHAFQVNRLAERAEGNRAGVIATDRDDAGDVFELDIRTPAMQCDRAFDVIAMNGIGAARLQLDVAAEVFHLDIRTVAAGKFHIACHGRNINASMQRRGLDTRAFGHAQIQIRAHRRTRIDTILMAANDDRVAFRDDLNRRLGVGLIGIARVKRTNGLLASLKKWTYRRCRRFWHRPGNPQ